MLTPADLIWPIFLRDGEALLEQIIHALPLGDERERELFAKFAEVSRATVKGTLLIGIVQGTLGGLMFALLGIEGAVFWGSIMVIMSLLPVVGASLVWGPAALIMAANGDYVKAGILVVFGGLVIGLIDNLLRPILVGRDTRMPDYLVLLSTLGGLSVFGQFSHRCSHRCVPPWWVSRGCCAQPAAWGQQWSRKIVR